MGGAINNESLPPPPMYGIGDLDPEPPYLESEVKAAGERDTQSAPVVGAAVLMVVVVATLLCCRKRHDRG